MALRSNRGTSDWFPETLRILNVENITTPGPKIIFFEIDQKNKNYQKNDSMKIKFQMKIDNEILELLEGIKQPVIFSK